MQIYHAPMQGHTDFDYRNTHAAVYGHIDAYYSPFVRLEKSTSFRNKDIKDIDPANNTAPKFVPQLIASTPTEADEIAKMLIAKGHKEIDINMGCPHRLMTIKGKGAAMLSDPGKVADVLAVADEHPDVEFTLKIRSGMQSHDECLAAASAINNSRIKHVTLHPRTAKQQYTGEASREAFARFAEACSKPLVYNGDITTCEDIDSIASQFPQLKGIMIGRGLLSNPALAMEWATGNELDEKQRKELLRKFTTMLRQAYEQRMQGGSQVLSHLKPMWEHLYPGMHKRERKKIIKSNNLESYERHVAEALR